MEGAADGLDGAAGAVAVGTLEDQGLPPTGLAGTVHQRPARGAQGDTETLWRLTRRSEGQGPAPGPRSSIGGITCPADSLQGQPARGARLQTGSVQAGCGLHVPGGSETADSRQPRGPVRIFEGSVATAFRL